MINLHYLHTAVAVYVGVWWWHEAVYWSASAPGGCGEHDHRWVLISVQPELLLVFKKKKYNKKPDYTVLIVIVEA